MRAADLRGLAQLTTQATVAVSAIAEGVHQSVWDTLGVRGGVQPGRTGGLTGLIYASVRGVAKTAGKVVDTAFAALQPLFASAEAAGPDSAQRDSVLAALNGVMGDRLAASGNPLATSMSLRCGAAVLDLRRAVTVPSPTDKLLVLVHGLCTCERVWSPFDAADRSDHAASLAALGYTPLLLRYNSGLHVSDNGRQLAQLLEDLVTHWPVPVTELSVLAHSMGGLVMRSALHDAQESGQARTPPPRWPALLKRVVFLGTPHHGAPLERAGNWVEVILGSSRFTAPFAALGRLRSAGITDLRHGNLCDEDWSAHDRFQRRSDSRRAVPLPAGVACYAVAATTAARRSPLADRLVGDGLVPLPSALGQHEDPRRALAFAPRDRWIAYRTSHMDLLTSPAVTQQLLHWFAD